MDITEFNILNNIHENRWPDEILGAEYYTVLMNVLTLHERVILELKVQLYEEGYSENAANARIAELLRIKLNSVTKHVYNIKSKYRHKMDTRVDNKIRPYSIYINAIRKGKKKYGRSFRKNI